MTTNTENESQQKPLKGPELIRFHMRTLPSTPGVYRMLDGRGEVLYVGKARNLKNRVSSYTRLHGHSNRIANMITATAGMEFVTTPSESEALLLEANLIKRYKPPFNVLMRDDKSFPYILLSKAHEAVRLMKHRGAQRIAGDYFGPFASAGSVNRTLNTLQRIFLLRSCTDAVYQSRTRPCLLYQIKRCAAPCTGEISLRDYDRLVAQARAFLSGKSFRIKEQLAKAMEAASAATEYEQAAIYRDRLAALTHIQAHQGINPRSIKEADVFGVAISGGQACVQVFFFRAHQNWGNRAYFPRVAREHGADEILNAFLAQFYDGKPCPKLVLMSHQPPDAELIAEALSLKAGRKVKLITPRRGEKHELVQYVTKNAEDALARRLSESATQRKLLDGVQTLFDLDAPPERIETYDNSHIQGAHAIGA
ncbi:MAG: excinuclease ABC subunit C, partial [Hyphomicrobiales bacterium]